MIGYLFQIFGLLLVIIGMATVVGVLLGALAGAGILLAGGGWLMYLHGTAWEESG